jgi:hypothetical protein
MRLALLRRILSNDRVGRPRLYLERDTGLAFFITGDATVRDEMLSCLQDRSGEALKVEGWGNVAHVVIAPIPQASRALRALGWGPGRDQAPPQPTPRHAPQRRRSKQEGKSTNGRKASR